MQSLQNLPASQPLGPVTRSQRRAANQAAGSVAGREVTRMPSNDQVNPVKQYLQTASQQVAEKVAEPQSFFSNISSRFSWLLGEASKSEKQTVSREIAQIAQSLHTAQDLDSGVSKLLELKGKEALTPQISFVIDTLELVPQKEQPQALIQILSHLDSLPIEGFYQSLVAMIRQTPKNLRMQLITLLPSAFGGLSLMERGGMIYPLVELSEAKNGVPLLAKVLPLMQDVTDAQKRAGILLTLQDMAPRQVPKIYPLLSRLFVGTYESVAYVPNLRKIDPEQRCQAIDDALPIVEQLSDETRDRFWTSFCKNTPEERTELLTLLRETLAVCLEQKQREEMCLAMLNIRAEQLAQVYQACQPHLEAKSLENLREVILDAASPFA